MVDNKEFKLAIGKYDSCVSIQKVAANTSSDRNPHDLYAYFDFNFAMPPTLEQELLEKQRTLGFGIHQTNFNIDYPTLFGVQFREMKPRPHRQAGPNNDLLDMFYSPLVAIVKNDINATFFVFGFPFKNNDGIHNVHMNQGNNPHGSHANENTKNHDGCLFVHYQDPVTNSRKWAGIISAFQSQSLPTDDNGAPRDNAQVLENFIQNL